MNDVTVKKKILRPSVRGLTFTTDNFDIGNHYRYIIDVEKNEILISPSDDGMTVSRKKCGAGYKPLIDIRSSEVRDLCGQADRMEVVNMNDSVLVHVYRTVKKVCFSKKASSGIIEFEDVIGEKIGTVELKKVSGGIPGVSYSQIPDRWKAALEKNEDGSIASVFDVVSLFSGAGLLDYAFYKDPAFRLAYATDFDAEACETYRANIGDIYCADIRNIKGEDVPDGDVVIGGPCCQGYSNANRTNIDSEVSLRKRLLIHDYIRIVQSVSPEVFVIENVPEMMTKDAGAHFKAVFDGLRDYHIGYAKLLDTDLGGYTNRKRLVIIGSASNDVIFPEIPITPPKGCREALDAVDDTWPNWNDVSESRAETKKIMHCVPNGGNWRDVPASVCQFHKNTHSNRYTRLDPDKPAPTITNWRKCVLMPYRKPAGSSDDWDRVLNVSEAAALMGLDKGFKFYGSLNGMQQAVANGVTQAMADYVKSMVRSLLEKVRKVVPFGHQYTLQEYFGNMMV